MTSHLRWTHWLGRRRRWRVEGTEGQPAQRRNPWRQFSRRTELSRRWTTFFSWPNGLLYASLFSFRPSKHALHFSIKLAKTSNRCYRNTTLRFKVSARQKPIRVLFLRPRYSVSERAMTCALWTFKPKGYEPSVTTKAMSLDAIRLRWGLRLRICVW